MIELTPRENGTVLAVKAQPNARANGILGERAGALRIGVTVAPEKGKANLAIAKVLAEAIGCRPSGLVPLSGETARDKRFLVLDVDAETLRNRLEALILDQS
jgi:uncharacterized protein YggU (UPF0235/DUF167 family)